MTNNLPTLTEIKARRKPIRNVTREHHEKLSSLEHAALWITKHVGSMGFFILIFLWTATWLLWNVVGPRELQFDPFPSFVLWLFISNMIQLFLLPLLMIGQNLEARYAEARAEADFEVNREAEQEIEIVLAHLEAHRELLEEIKKSLGKKQKK